MTTSEPAPTGGSGLWPTPKATDGERGGRGDLWAMVNHGKVSHRRDWPKPAAPPEDDQPLTLFAADSPASPSASPASASRKPTNGGSGLPWRTPFADYDPGSRSWRTFQGFLFAEWETFSATWPRAGMTRSGTVCQRQPSAPLTAEIAFGSWATPTAAERGRTPEEAAQRHLSGRAMGRNGGASADLTSQVVHRMWRTPLSEDATHPGRSAIRSRARTLALSVQVNNPEYWPTPTANRWDGLQSHGINAISGQLNPAWVEWLMGYPDGWTDCAD
jgi:hypothetical protein